MVVPPILHRDLRSSNVFVWYQEGGREGNERKEEGKKTYPRGKVADFGLSSFVFGRITSQSLPSYQWLAPEVSY